MGIFSILQGKFAINSQTGEVTVARELDFETVRIYSLKIVAKDKGTDPKSGYVVVVLFHSVL